MRNRLWLCIVLFLTVLLSACGGGGGSSSGGGQAQTIRSDLSGTYIISLTGPPGSYSNGRSYTLIIQQFSADASGARLGGSYAPGNPNDPCFPGGSIGGGIGNMQLGSTPNTEVFDSFSLGLSGAKSGTGISLDVVTVIVTVNTQEAAFIGEFYTAFSDGQVAGCGTGLEKGIFKIRRI